VQKNFEFFEIFSMSARTSARTRGEDVAPVRTFCGQRGGQFLRFCVDVFYGWLLTNFSWFVTDYR